MHGGRDEEEITEMDKVGKKSEGIATLRIWERSRFGDRSLSAPFGSG